MSKIKYPDSEYSMAITCVEDMPAVAADIVKSYCDRYGIDERDIYPSIWSDIITELYVSFSLSSKHYP